MSKKILVVDDETNILMMVEARLKNGGYSVITANSGTAALEQVKKEHPDLIILDVMMPPPNGLQLCRMLKDEEEYREIPVILLTAKATESDHFWGAESGADMYLTKPYNPEELLNHIKTLLER